MEKSLRREKINKFFTAVKNFALDTIFPKYCVFCDYEGQFLCHQCFSKIVLQSPKADEKSIIAGSYKDYYLREIIHYLKYRYVTDLAKPLALILITVLRQKFPQSFFDSKKILIVPVPLFKKKLKQRGFNQSELIANIIGGHFNFQVAAALQKIKNTPAQMTISEKSKRLVNLQNVFQCVTPNMVKDKEILLIDDVVTTGATMEECAKVLKQAGARKVWKIAVAG